MDESWPPSVCLSDYHGPYPHHELENARRILIRSLQMENNKLWQQIKVKVGITPGGEQSAPSTNSQASSLSSNSSAPARKRPGDESGSLVSAGNIDSTVSSPNKKHVVDSNHGDSNHGAETAGSCHVDMQQIMDILNAARSILPNFGRQNESGGQQQNEVNNNTEVTPPPPAEISADCQDEHETPVFYSGIQKGFDLPTSPGSNSANSSGSSKSSVNTTPVQTRGLESSHSVRRSLLPTPQPSQRRATPPQYHTSPGILCKCVCIFIYWWMCMGNGGSQSIHDI